MRNLKFIAKYYKPIIIFGTLLIFLKDILKLLLKSTGNIDIIDIFADILLFVVFIIAVMIIRKNYKD